MKINVRYLLIQLLLAAIVSLGIAQAGGEVCPPGCSHCLASVSPSCCDDMGRDVGPDHMPGNTGDGQRPADCGHGSLCPGNSVQNEVAVGFTVPSFELASVLPAVAAFIPLDHPLVHITIRPQSLLLGKPPAIYTLNCSFLI